MSRTSDTFILVNVRDRVTPLRKLIDWLERAGHERIVLLDNASTYEPLLEFYEKTPHAVHFLEKNYGSRSVWLAGLVPDEPFVFTDPDILPIEDCPFDAIEHFRFYLDRHDVPKVGFGLYLDDVPADFRYRPWEAGPSIQGELLEPGARESLIDTTFALYRPGPFVHQAIRTEYPYQARHLSQSWYGGPVSDEDQYYLERAIQGPDGSSWAQVV